jgi:hypothetical protein
MLRDVKLLFRTYMFVVDIGTGAELVRCAALSPNLEWWSIYVSHTVRTSELLHRSMHLEGTDSASPRHPSWLDVECRRPADRR